MLLFHHILSCISSLTTAILNGVRWALTFLVSLIVRHRSLKNSFSHFYFFLLKNYFISLFMSYLHVCLYTKYLSSDYGGHRRT